MTKVAYKRPSQTPASLFLSLRSCLDKQKHAQVCGFLDGRELSTSCRLAHDIMIWRQSPHNNFHFVKES